MEMVYNPIHISRLLNSQEWPGLILIRHGIFQVTRDGFFQEIRIHQLDLENGYHFNCG